MQPGRSAALAIAATACLGVGGSLSGGQALASCLPPPRVSVLPVFFVPADQAAPSAGQQARLMRQLTWCQSRYHEMLRRRDTFALAPQGCLVYHAQHTLAECEAMPEGGAPVYVQELLSLLHFSRFNCPYILLTVTMNPKTDYPPGGGRPLNGGVNTGGGIVLLSSHGLDLAPNFQSTLQHELGHSFGLPHVDCYGYDMSTNASIMSYNPAHHTRGFDPSPTPGTLIPEDLRALALNHRVFAKLSYRIPQDLPPHYAICPGLPLLGPMTIPGQPPYRFAVTTSSGEAYGSRVENLAWGVIKPDAGPGNTYDANTMWHSERSGTGWVSVEVSFGESVTLTGMAAHTEHSGEAHRAHALAIQVGDGVHFADVGQYDLPGPDARIDFPRASGRVWRLRLQAGPSGCVVVRGLRFYLDDTEVFPPMLAPEASTP